MNNVKKLWQWLSPYKLMFFATVALAAFSAVFAVLASLSIAHILNAAIAQDTQAFVVNCLYSAALFLGSVVCSFFHERLRANVKANVVRDMRQAVVGAVQQADYQQFKAESPERYAALMVTDLDMVTMRILDTLFKMMVNLFNLVASIAGLIYLHYSLLILAAVLALLLFTLPSFFQRKMQSLAQNVATHNSNLLAAASHWFGGFSVLNDSDTKHLIQEKLQEPVDAVWDAKVADEHMAAFVNMVSSVLSLLAQFSMIILTGYLAVNQVVTPGSVLSTGNLASMIFGPLGVLVMFYTQFQSGFGVLDSVVETVDRLKQSQSVSTDFAVSASDMRIATENVHVAFSDGRSVDVPNVTFAGLGNYAIVGPSGIGKSVFLNLVAKNIDVYDGLVAMNGVDMSTLSERQVKAVVAYVPQQTYIFNMSAKDNIMLGNPQATEADYQAAVRAAGLQQVFDSWTNGDATLIGTQHTQVSGGQAQRINIARALVTKKPILLFDEVTANLDKAVAQSIEEAIQHIPNRLKISVTHHLNEQNSGLYDNVVDFGVRTTS